MSMKWKTISYTQLQLQKNYVVKEDFSFINGLPTNEEEYNNNIRWLNGGDGNQLYHADQKLTWNYNCQKHVNYKFRNW